MRGFVSFLLFGLQFPRNLKIPHTFLFSFVGMQSWANFVNLDFSFLCLSFKIFILQSFLQFFGVLYCGGDFSLWTSGMIFIPFSLIVIEKFLCFLKKKTIDNMWEIYKIFIKPCRYIYIVIWVTVSDQNVWFPFCN